jgi:hypothetical protein
LNMALSPLGIALMQQPQPLPPGQLQPTNVTADYQLAQNAAEQNYQAQLAQQNAMWGGLAGLGSAGILAGSKYFGGAGGAASGAGSAAAGAGAADAGGAAAADAGAGAAADAGTAAAATLPDWLTSAAAFLPFLAA